VDGKPWPAQSATTLHLPAGPHTIEPTAKREAISLIDLNGKLRSASTEPGKRIAFEYSSESRAIARFDRRPSRLELDGAEFAFDCSATGECAVLLPRGDHKVAAR
jgi:hypothetical protein